MFEHKRERIATAVANLEILSDADFGRRFAIVERTAPVFDVKKSWILGTSPDNATPDGCATWAANNLRKLVLEERELARLTPGERARIDAWLAELRKQCARFALRQPIDPAKERRLSDASQQFQAWAPR
jgi:hypothetical protein